MKFKNCSENVAVQVFEEKATNFLSKSTKSFGRRFRYKTQTVAVVFLNATQIS